MTNRSTTVWFVVVITLVLALMLIFRIKVAMLGAKYLVLLIAIIVLVAMLIPRKPRP